MASKVAEQGKVNLFVRIPPILEQRLRELADSNERPLSWEVRSILIRYLRDVGKWSEEDDSKAKPRDHA